MARMGHGQMEQYIQQETQKQQMQVNGKRKILREYSKASHNKKQLKHNNCSPRYLLMHGTSITCWTGLTSGHRSPDFYPECDDQTGWGSAEPC